MSQYPHLFSPIKIGNVTLKNRIEVPPMGVSPNTSGFLTAETLKAMELRAMGGAAVVTRGETLVHAHTGSAHGNLCNLDDEGFMSTHIELTDIIHQHNALANIEILHCGARAHPKYTGGVVYGPSAQPGVYGVDVTPMDEDMMETIADAFAHGAAVAKFGGFDMVMIHGGHGWLLSQFLSPIYNTRKDQYGGSMENRARFPLMVIDRIRKAVGKGFPIEFRMSGDEFLPGGYGLDEAVEFARMLEGKVDLVHVSATSFRDVNSGCRMFPSAFLPHGVNVYLAERIKQNIKTPVATVGALSSPAEMEEIIASGKADIVAVGRAILADPYLPEKARTGRVHEIRPCVRCNHCLSLDFVPYVPMCSGVSQCTVNPLVGRELRELTYAPKPQPKHVVVVGGGPGGMQAAIKAADQGHRVTLIEQSGQLGGMLNFATRDISFKADLKRFTQYLIDTTKSSSIRILYNTAATKSLLDSLQPDTVVCAVGGQPIVPPIEGVEKGLQITRIHEDDVRLGDKIVVIGGGLVGCEEALALAMAGKTVTVLEMREELAPDAPVLHLKAMLLEYAKYPETLKPVTGMTVRKITDRGVVAVDKNGVEQEFAADTVLISAGMQPKYDLVESLRSSDYQFITVGDCVKVGKVRDAITGGYFAGKNA